MIVVWIHYENRFSWLYSRNIKKTWLGFWDELQAAILFLWILYRWDELQEAILFLWTLYRWDELQAAILFLWKLYRWDELQAAILFLWTLYRFRERFSVPMNTLSFLGILGICGHGIKQIYLIKRRISLTTPRNNAGSDESPFKIYFNWLFLCCHFL